MKLDELKLFYVFSTVVLCLIILSPTLAMTIKLPSREGFSELWMLGSNYTAEDYPFNVTSSTAYRIYLGLSNYMGSLTHYVIYVKFRNQTEPLPNATAGIPSSLPVLCEYHVFLSDGETWETPLTFSLHFDSQNLVKAITIESTTLSVDKSAVWDDGNNGFYYQLFFELWAFDTKTADFQFYNQFVGLWLNTTSSP